MATTCLRRASRIHKIGTMAADRERIATAFEEMARIIRAGREGWGMRAVGNATKILDKIPRTSKVLPELFEGFIAHSGPNAPLLRMMMPIGGREEKSIEGRIVASSERIEGLPPLERLDSASRQRGSEIGKPIDVPGCACTAFDDGSSFCLGSFAGGHAKSGVYSFVRCVETLPDGSTKIHYYTRTEEPSRG